MKINVRHKGFKIKYHENLNRWVVNTNGLNEMRESLIEIRQLIDEFITKKFKNVTVFKHIKCQNEFIPYKIISIDPCGTIYARGEDEIEVQFNDEKLILNNKCNRKIINNVVTLKNKIKKLNIKLANKPNFQYFNSNNFK